MLIIILLCRSYVGMLCQDSEGADYNYDNGHIGTLVLSMVVFIDNIS